MQLQAFHNKGLHLLFSVRYCKKVKCIWVAPLCNERYKVPHKSIKQNKWQRQVSGSKAQPSIKSLFVQIGAQTHSVSSKKANVEPEGLRRRKASRPSSGPVDPCGLCAEGSKSQRRKQWLDCGEIFKQIPEINVTFHQHSAAHTKKKKINNGGDMCPTADSTWKSLFCGILNQLQFLQRRQPRGTEAYIINSGSCFEAQ